MYCYCFTYEYTFYKRRDTYGGMDSEPDGTEIRTGVDRVVVPEQSPVWEVMAKTNVDWRAKMDPAFKITNTSGHSINAIMSIQTRL